MNSSSTSPTDEIPNVADIIPDFDVLDGDKVDIEKIFNIPIVVTGWIIAPSKKNKGEDYLRFQFTREGETERFVCMGGSTVLMDQLREIEAALDAKNMPHKFRAVVRKIGRYHKFCRS